MKNLMVLMVGLICHNLTIQAQEKDIQEKIQLAKKNGGIEYNEGGQVKIAVNISKVEYYYKWITTADTISAYMSQNTLNSVLNNGSDINDKQIAISFSELRARYTKDRELEKRENKSTLALENPDE